MISLLFTILIVAVCALLIMVVLIQNPKGGGISSGFTAANQIMGVKQSTDLVEKWTWYLAVGLVVLCLFSAPMMGGSVAGPTEEMETTVPASNIPQGLPGGGLPQPQ